MYKENCFLIKRSSKLGLCISLMGLFLVSHRLNSQKIVSNVINAAGSDRTSSTISLTDNIGEPFVMTVNNNGNKITQGFLQPTITSIKGFSVSSIFQGLKCLDKESDAFISLSVAPSVKTQTVTYLWSPSTVCPTSDCPKVDSLNPGIYTVTIAITYKNNDGSLVYDTLKPAPITIDNASSPCVIKVYNGITANGDGLDEVLKIDNITEFPENRVTIYNRWGEMLFDVKGYNDKDASKSWPTEKEKNELPASTYFYIIELGNGNKPVKGWVELIKN